MDGNAKKKEKKHPPPKDVDEKCSIKSSISTCCGLRPEKKVSEVVLQENTPNEIPGPSRESIKIIDNSTPPSVESEGSIYDVPIEALYHKLIALFRKYYIYAIIQALVLLLPLPDTLSGALTGVILLIVFEPIWSRVLDYFQKLAHSNLASKATDARQSMMYDSSPVEEHTNFKTYEGWMCETNAYDPETFKITMSRVVHVRIDGTIMTVSNTTANIAHKAMWNENLPEADRVTFTQHRIYDLRGCRVILLPENLPKKRYFNRKYPIKLLFKRPCSIQEEKTEVKEADFLAQLRGSLDSEDTLSHFGRATSSAGVPSEFDSEQVSITSSILSYNEDKVAATKKQKRGGTVTADFSDILLKATDRLMRGEHARKEAGEQTDENIQEECEDNATATTDEVAAESHDIFENKTRRKTTVSFKEGYEFEETIEQSQKNSPKHASENETASENISLTQSNEQEDKLSTNSLTSAMGEEEEKCETCEKNIQLILFSRTDRAKEDWYGRFINASKGNVFDRVLTLPNLRMVQYRDLLAGRLREVPGTIHPEPAFKTDATGAPIQNRDKRLNALDDEDDDEASAYHDDYVEGLLLCKNVARNSPDYLRFMFVCQQACKDPSIPVFKQKHLQTTKHRDKKRVLKAKHLKHRKKEDVWKGLQQSLFLGPSGSIVWLNVVIGRFIYSCLHNANLQASMQDFLQKKLHAVKLPGYVEDISITAIELGNTPPLIHRISQPLLDERGIWVAADVTYEGFLHLIAAAKLLVRRQKQPGKEATPPAESGLEDPNKGTAVTGEQINGNEDASTSSMGTDDSRHTLKTPSSKELDGVDYDADDAIDEINAAAEDAAFTLKNIRRVSISGLKKRLKIPKILNKYSRRSMHYALINMNADATLRIDLKGLVARVILNIPPPPSDRVWLGFAGPPRMWVQARPTVGDKSIQWNIVNFVIERKIRDLIQRIMVYPNMVDFTVGLLGHTKEE